MEKSTELIAVRSARKRWAKSLRRAESKTYTPAKIKAELAEYGFSYAGTCTQKGVHWEKCHTLYYIKKGNITFDILEKVDVMNFVKK